MLVQEWMHAPVYTSTPGWEAGQGELAASAGMQDMSFVVRCPYHAVAGGARP